MCIQCVLRVLHTNQCLTANMHLYITAKTSWLFKPQSGYHSCRQAEETVVPLGIMVLVTNFIRQPNRKLPSSSYNHNTLTTLRTSVKESLQMHFKVAVRNLDESTDVMRVFSVFICIYVNTN